jgi:hypothetical protein
MAALVAAIHVFLAETKVVDARDNPRIKSGDAHDKLNVSKMRLQACFVPPSST